MLSLSKMREGGVYLLPDGERLIAVGDHRGGFLLYAPKVWQHFHGWGPAEYDVVAEGRIVDCDADAATRWSVRDLVDTGETRRPLPAPEPRGRDQFFY
jgi:hypothetical protein